MSGDCDVIVIGGGPGGALAGRELARAGLHAVVLERATFPRFRIGESFLPAGLDLLRRLGLESRLADVPRVRKLGGEFGMGHGRDGTVGFYFQPQPGGGGHVAFNVERCRFDAMLLDAARDAGATVREATAVRRIAALDDGAVAVETDDGATLRGRWLVDASGQATVVGRHLGTRRVLDDLRKVAYHAQFEGVDRNSGDQAGFPTIAMCREGWFWLIPLDERRTSVGFVLDADVARATGVPAREMLRWGIERCPLIRGRMRGAGPPAAPGVIADFTYRCAPYAGPGYFLVGDAATFIDPIFSTGVCLSMAGGVEVAAAIARIERGGATPARERRRYARWVDGSSAAFFRLVRGYYDHAFRELFLHGRGPLDTHGAVLSILGGHVFPRPRFGLRWRLRLFELLVAVHRRRAIVPRREDFSLLETPPEPPAAGARDGEGAWHCASSIA